jgi:hypothetical protein
MVPDNNHGNWGSMEGTNIESLVLKAGMGTELIAALKTVMHNKSSEGAPKYSRSICHELERRIAGRIYGRVMLELCHLMHIADHCGGRGRYRSFFWGIEIAQTSAFQGLAHSAAKSTLFHPAQTTVEITYPDGEFAIAYSRMPFLAAMMDFLIDFIGFPALDGVMVGLLSGNATVTATSDAANTLSRQVYDKLKDQLPKAQIQRKRHALVKYLHENQVQVEEINDDTVLNFWIERSADQGGGDFKTFESVFRTAVDLSTVIKEARGMDSFENTLSIGTDPDSGQIDPGNLINRLETLDGPRRLLDELDEPPVKNVKFLNNKERELLSSMIECGSLATDFPLSLLRCEVFGKEQSRLAHIQRHKLKPAEMRKEIEKGPLGDYLTVIGKFEQLSLHIKRVSLASLFVLACARNSQALSLILELAPDIDLSDLAEQFEVKEYESENVVSLQEGWAANLFFTILSDPDKVNPQLARLMTTAEKEFKSISRSGFGADEKDDLNIQAGHEQGEPVIRSIGTILKKFRDKLSNIDAVSPGLEGYYTGDLKRYIDQFHLLYWKDAS